MRKQRKAGLGIFYSIEGNLRIGAFAALLFVPFAFVLSVLFLNLCGVQQYDFGNFGGGRGAVNFAGESFLDELGQQAAMVEVGVC